MPVFNGSRFLDRAFGSLSNQTFRDWELLAVDDASTDDSAARLDNLASSDPRVRVLRHSVNRGQSAARNTALGAAHGELVAYLDQDDEFYPDHLERAWGLRDRADVLLFRYDLVEERPGNPNCGAVTTYDLALRARALFDETIAVPLGVVHRRDLLARTGGFDTALGRYRGEDEDGDLWRRFARAGARFAYVPERSGRYHVRADSVARTRPPAPPPPARVITAEVRTPSGRYSLWLPAADAWRVGQVFERQEYGLDRTWLRVPPVVLDVGANAGAFALYAKLAYHPDAVVHCFEPYPATADLLRANVGRFAGVTVHPIGLGRTDGVAGPLTRSWLPAAHTLSARLAPTPADRDSMSVRDAGRVWDELGFGEVDVLKLNAEGREADVLEALGPRLTRVRVAAIEYHAPEDRRRTAALLGGHVPVAAHEHTPRAGVVKFVRPDVLSATRG